MRLAGFQIGHGTTIWGSPTIIGRGDIRQNLSVGNDVILNVGCLIDLASTVTIDDTAAIGYEVMLITGAHTIGPTQRRAAGLAPKPIYIGSGAWLGTRCVILPGVTIGEGVVVAAGAVVNRNMPANVMVAGVPAKIIKRMGQTDYWTSGIK